MAQTVLVIGSTGNIGCAAVKAALSSGCNVLAVVRSQTSAEKLKKFIGTSDGITFAEADVASEYGVKGVVDRVRAGELPAFQHVWCSVGGEYLLTKLSDLTPEVYNKHMRSAGNAGFYAYIHTIKYLWEQNHPSSTWTICTGGQVDLATIPLLALGQGPIVVMSKAACRECAGTNVRFNEVYLCMRVEVDEHAARHKVTSATEFSQVYRQILEEEEIGNGRVSVFSPADMKDLKFKKW